MSAAEVAAWPPIEIVLGKRPGQGRVTLKVQPQAYLQKGWFSNPHLYAINIDTSSKYVGAPRGVRSTRVHSTMVRSTGVADIFIY